MGIICKSYTKNDDEDSRRRMEYEAIMQFKDQAHLLFEMLMAQSYCSGPLYDIRKKLDELGHEVSIGV